VTIARAQERKYVDHKGHATSGGTIPDLAGATLSVMDMALTGFTGGTSIVPINGIAQGSGASQRIGSEAVIDHVTGRVLFTCRSVGASVGTEIWPQRFRYVVFAVRALHGRNPATLIDQLFIDAGSGAGTSTNLLAFRNLEASEDVVVLRDRIVKVEPNALPGTDTGRSQEGMIEFNLDIPKSLQVTKYSGSGNTAADIQGTGLFFALGYHGEGGNTAPELEEHWFRVRFYG
jgi:hypothetical protein